jgi:hypothetical protein
MAITIEIPPAIEMQIREQAASGNADAVRHLLIEALDPAVEALIRRHTLAQVSNDTFEILADQLADTFLAYAGPDCPSLSDSVVHDLATTD